MGEPTCTICHGTKAEHGPGKTVHVFTTQEGQLMTEADQKKGQVGQPQMIRLPGAQTSEAQAVGRLVEILLEKGIVDMPEAIYIAGMGTKPEKKFAEPPQMMPVNKP